MLRRTSIPKSRVEFVCFQKTANLLCTLSTLTRRKLFWTYRTRWDLDQLSGQITRDQIACLHCSEQTIAQGGGHASNPRLNIFFHFLSSIALDLHFKVSRYLYLVGCVPLILFFPPIQSLNRVSQILVLVSFVRFTVLVFVNCTGLYKSTETAARRSQTLPGLGWGSVGGAGGLMPCSGLRDKRISVVSTVTASPCLFTFVHSV